MKTRNFEITVDSSSVWKYQNLLVDQDRPRHLSIHNESDQGIFFRVMNKNEGNGEGNDKFYVPASTIKRLDIESAELPYNRIGLLLASGSIAINVNVSAANFQRT